MMNMEQAKKSLEQANVARPKKKITCKISYEPLNAIDVNVSTTEELAQVKLPKKKNQEYDLEEPEEVSFRDKSSNESLERSQEWNCILLPPQIQFMTLQRPKILKHINTNVIIEIDDMMFQCHLMLLQSYSIYFRKMERGRLRIVLPSDKITQKSFFLLYVWMLSDAPVLKREQILEVYKAATYLQINELLKHCWGYFDSVKNYAEDEAVITYIQTWDHEAFDLVCALSLLRINKCFLVFVASHEFLKMPLTHFRFLLKSHSVSVNAEIEMFFAAVRWFSYNWDERRPRIAALLEHVRFYLIPVWNLVDISRNTENDIIHYMVTTPEVQQLISTAIEDNTTFTSDAWKMGSSREEIERLEKVKNTPQRAWIYDKNCSYHKPEGEVSFCNIEYAQFLEYLAMLQKAPVKYWKTEFQRIKNQIFPLNTKKAIEGETTMIKSKNIF